MSSINQRRYESTSPSAITAYRSCARSWYWNYCLGFRGPTPPYMSKGTSIHHGLEVYLKTGEVLIEHENSDNPGTKWQIMEFTQAAIPLLPRPLSDKEHWDALKGGDESIGLLLEQSGEMATWTDPDGEMGPAFRQYLDLVIALKDQCIVQDHKTLSDARYAKTPEELSVNVQLISNAKYLAMVSDYKEFTLRHMYLLTKGKRPKAWTVEVTVSREHIEAEWQKILATIREMAAYVKLNPPTAEPLPPTLEACSSYGGCPHRERCFGNTVDLVPIRRSNMKEGEKMSLLKEMMSRAGTAAKPITPTSGTVTPAGGAAVTATLPATGSILLGKVAPAAGASPPKSSSPLLAGLLKKPAPPAEPIAQIFTPEMAQAAAVAAGYPIEMPAPAGVLPTGIVPPDAPSPISTPEEVAAANPEPKPTVEEREKASAEIGAVVEKQKRTRRTKAQMEADRAAEAAAEPKVEEVLTKAVDQVPLSEQYSAQRKMLEKAVENMTQPDVQTTVSPEAIDEVVKADAEETEADKLRKIISTPDQAFGCGVEALFIDCYPGKGWVGEQPVDVLEFVHAFNSLASSSAGVPDYRLIKYESKAYLATAIKVYMKGLPRALFIDTTRTPAVDILLENLVPHCKMIFRGVR